MDNTVHDAQRLKELRALPLERKIRITQNRIQEWYMHYDGGVYVSFSGGKDSTVLAHLTKQLFPDVPLVFSNTGLEYSSIQKFARDADAVFVYPKMGFSDVVSTYGTVVYIEDVGIRIVQDKGAGVQGNHIDIAVSGSHEDALKWTGYGEHRVWIIKETD